MRALIAMSGGVDSSVAARLMKDRGYECIGCTMKLYQNEDAGRDRTRTCCSLDDVEDARSVAYQMGMPFYVFNFTDEFRSKVIGRFVDCYEHAMTPNPCIDCNRTQWDSAKGWGFRVKNLFMCAGSIRKTETSYSAATRICLKEM